MDNISIRKTLENEEEISLTTKHLDRYSFHLPNTYKFTKDTVLGLIKSEQWNMRYFRSIKIPFHSLHKIEQKEIDGARTTLLVTAIGGLIYCISNFEPGFSLSSR